MKRFINWRSSRFIRRCRLTWARTFMRRGRFHRPIKSTLDVQAGLKIWNWALRQTDSIMLYDPVAHECFLHLEREGHPLHMILEGGALRIINSVIGYDVRLSSNEHGWAEQSFFDEVHKRRQEFRAEIFNRVQHSLVDLYQDLSHKK